MLHDISHDTTTGGGSDAPAPGEPSARQQAIKQIQRKRRFWISTAFGTVGMILLVAIWAITEYHNAGGWPASGFSQSSGIHDVWNIWIIYPLIAWVLLTVAHAWSVYRPRPISEREIQREIERQGGRPS
jgi:hypothetical protein